MSRLLALATALVIALACGGGGDDAPTEEIVDEVTEEAPAIADDAFLAEVAELLTTAAVCAPDAGQGWLCAATRAGEADLATLSEPRSRIGLATVVPRAGGMQDPELAVLHLHPDGARVTDLVPSTEEEVAELEALAATVTRVLSGSEEYVAISPGLDTYLREQRAVPPHPLDEAATGARFHGNLASWIGRLETASGPVWVVIERWAQGAIVSVYPDRDLLIVGDP